jgi:multidrug efflux pump subunit AcrB
MSNAHGAPARAKEAPPGAAWVQVAMRHPVSIVVLVLAMVLAGVHSLATMQFDIFPNLGTPTIYLAEPYGGLDPSQIESQITYNFENHFLY